MAVKNNPESSHADDVLQHYIKCWGRTPDLGRWPHGPTHELPNDFRVAVFRPHEQRQMWSYATCGMSVASDEEALELHLFSPREANELIELLTVVSHYHRNVAPLGLGHTVNLGRPWLDDSPCAYGLISLPYLDGSKLEWLNMNEKRVRFLWLIPITEGERDYKALNGLEALERRFDEAQLDYLEPRRASVVHEAT